MEMNFFDFSACVNYFTGQNANKIEKEPVDLLLGFDFLNWLTDIFTCRILGLILYVSGILFFSVVFL